MTKKATRGRLPDDVQSALDVISKMVDDCCRDHLQMDK